MLVMKKVEKASVIHSMHVTYDHTQPSKQPKPHGVHICIHEYLSRGKNNA
jgi:hypothetical protein